jgi:hypothetical protein
MTCGQVSSATTLESHKVTCSAVSQWIAPISQSWLADKDKLMLAAREQDKCDNNVLTPSLAWPSTPAPPSSLLHDTLQRPQSPGLSTAYLFQCHHSPRRQVGAMAHSPLLLLSVDVNSGIHDTLQRPQLPGLSTAILFQCHHSPGRQVRAIIYHGSFTASRSTSIPASVPSFRACVFSRFPSFETWVVRLVRLCLAKHVRRMIEIASKFSFAGNHALCPLYTHV